MSVKSKKDIYILEFKFLCAVEISCSFELSIKRFISLITSMPFVVLDVQVQEH